jgi:hypothetical protein
VSFKLTAWKSEPVGVVETLAGEALLADLVTMIQRVSRRAPVEVVEGSTPLLVDDVASALHVSRRTLVRIRRFGLTMRYARFSDGQLRLVCEPSTLAWFRQQRGGLIGQACARPPQIEASEVIALAVSAQPHATMQATVQAIGPRCPGRSAAAIRSILRRAVRRGELLIPTSARLRGRDEVLAERAMRRGVAPAAIAHRLGVGIPSMHRAVQRRRAARLRQIDAQIPATAADVPAEDTLLAVDDLSRTLPPWDLAISLDGKGGQSPAAADLAAQHLLRQRIHQQVSVLARQPTAAAIDQIESDFRWMTQLRWRLLTSLAAGIRQAVEHRVGRDPLSLPAGTQRLVLERSLALLGELLSRQLIGDFARLPARARAAIDRMLAGERSVDPGRASARLAAHPAVSMVTMERWPAILPDPRWEAWWRALPADAADIVQRRWGLGGVKPQTMQSMATELGCTVPALARRWASSQQQLLDIGRRARPLDSTTE